MATGSETTSSASSTAKAPTGEILKFVEAFNKDFDSEIIELKNEVEKAKLILASASQIPIPKTGTFPRNDNSVKTIGDLYKYTYNLETGESLEPKVKYQPVPAGATPIADEDSVEDWKGFNKDTNDTKSLKFEIEKGIRSKKEYDEKNRLKNPQGLNPSLWSPGLYYFESVWLEMVYYMTSVKDYSRFNSEAQFSWPYQRDLNDGKETFSFSISTYTPDGDIDYKNNKFYKKDGYNDDDGLAGYSRFYGLLLQASYNWDLGKIASIGIQDLYGDGYLGKTNSTRFPSLRTQYHTGKLEDLKTNPKFQYTRGEVSDDKVYFYGNKEFISLYKAVLQAGDNYQPVTFDINKPPDAPAPPIAASPSTTSSSTQPTGTTGSSQSVPKFIFNVEDEKTFFCKDPAIEFHIIPSTNDVSQPLPVYREETTDDDVLDEEFIESDLSQSNGENFLSPEEKAENERYAQENQVKDNTKPPEKITKVEQPVTGTSSTSGNDITTTTTTKKPKNDTKETIPTGGFTVDVLPTSSIDTYSNLSKVPYYGQFDARWGNNLYGKVTLEGGDSFFWENNTFITTFNQKRGYEIEGVIKNSGTDKDGKKFRVRLDAGGWPAGDIGLSSISDAGCGITSLSMIINYWATKRKSSGRFTTPIKMAKMATSVGARPGKFITKFTKDYETLIESEAQKKKTYALNSTTTISTPWVLETCQGTGIPSLIKPVLKEFDLKITSLNNKADKDEASVKKVTQLIDDELKQGNPVLWLFNSSYKSAEKPTTGPRSAKGVIKVPGGHYMVIVTKADFDGKLRYIVNDPGASPASRTVYIDSISDLFAPKHTSSFWSVKPEKNELFT